MTALLIGAAVLALVPASPALAEATRAGNAGALAGEAAGSGGGGSANGSKSGDFTQSYPIDVPIGRRGQQPSVALSYSSSGRVHGGVASGWSLSAGGAITVDPTGGTVRAEWPTGGSAAAPRNFLDPAGRPLVRDDGVPTISGAVGYRAIGDGAYTAFQYLGDAASQYWWEVSYQGGTKAYFGLKNAHPYSMAPLVRVIDPDGLNEPHELKYNYETVGRTAAAPGADQPREFLLTSIDYEAPSLDHAYARVEFGYAAPVLCGADQAAVGSRLDYRLGFAQLSGTRKLTSIRTFTRQTLGGEFKPRSVYSLGYSGATEACGAPTAPFRQLESIQRIVHRPAVDGQDGPLTTMLPVTRFTYGEAASYVQESHYRPAESVGTFPSATLRLPESVDTNQFFTRDPENPNQFRFSPVNPGGTGCSTPLCPLPAGNQHPHKGSWMLATAQSTGESASRLWLDINGDGRTDLIERPGGPPKLATASPQLGGCKIDVYLNKGTGFYKQTDSGEFPPFSLAKAMADIPVPAGTPADGAGQLLCTLSRSFSADNSGGFFGNPAQPCAHPEWGAQPGWKSMQQARQGFADMDGDRLPDLVVQPVASLECPYASTHGVPAPLNRPTADIEDILGDPHWLREYIDATLDPANNTTDPRVITKRQRYLYIYRNTGSGFAATPVQAQAPSLTSGWRGILGRAQQGVLSGYYSSYGGNNTPVTQRDVNGDGRPDQVYESGDYQAGRSAYALSAADLSWPTWVHLDGQAQNLHLGASVQRDDWSLDPAVGDPALDRYANYTGYLHEGLGPDINDDGLPDKVHVQDWGVPTSEEGTQVNFNTGHGFASEAQDGQVMFSIGAADTTLLDSFRAPDLTQRNWQYYPHVAERSGRTRMLDLDYDGLQDVLFYDREANRAELYNSSGRQWVNTRTAATGVAQSLAGVIRANGTSYGGTTQEYGDRADYRYTTQHMAADLNGDGLLDLLSDPEGDGMTVRYARDVIGSGDTAAPARLMRTVTTGTGAKTTISYERDTAARKWVTSTIKVTPGQNQPDITTAYSYLKPVHQAGRYGQVGFHGYGEVHTKRSSEPGLADDRIEVSQYRYDRAPAGEVVRSVTVAGHGVPATGITESQPGVMRLVEHENTLGGLGSRPPGMRPDYPARGVLPEEQVSYVCTGAGGQAMNACRASAPSVTQRSQWTSRFEGGDFVADVLFRTETEFVNGQGQQEIRRTLPTFNVAWNTGGFVIAPQRMVSLLVRDGLETALGETRYTYQDAHFRRLRTSTVDDARPEVADRVSRVLYHGGIGTDRGQAHRVWAPEQVARHGNSDTAPGFTEFEYDLHGMHVVSERNPVGHLVTTVVDPATGMALETEGPNYGCPDGPDVGTVLDPPSACTAQTAQSLNLTERSQLHVDGLGRVIRAVSYPISESGHEHGVELMRATFNDRAAEPVSSTTPVSSVVETRIGNGQFSHITTEVDGLGRTVRTAVRQDGTITRVTNQTYDAQGRPRDMTSPRGDDQPGTVTMRIGYDALGRRVSVGEVQANGVVNTRHTYAYDGLTTTSVQDVDDSSSERRSVLTADPLGQLISVAEKWDGYHPDALTRYAYDGQGNTATVTDPDGVVTAVTHDYSGNRRTVTRAGRTWQFGYDANDNATTVIEPTPVGQNQAAYTHTRQYDDLDRVTRMLPAQRDLSAAELAEFKTGPTELRYDIAHASLNTTNSEGSFTVGRLTATTSAVATAITRYDNRGNATTTSQQLHALEGLPGITADRLQVHSTLDAAGIPTTTRYLAHNTSGQTTFTGVRLSTAAYDLDGMPRTLEFDLAGQPVTTTNDRNRAGLVSTISTDTDAEPTIHLARDGYGRISGLSTTVEGENGPLQRYRQELSYHDNGLVAQLTEQLGHTDQPTSITEYWYDHRHQLITASQAGGRNYFSNVGMRPSGRLSYANVVSGAAGTPEDPLPVRMTSRFSEYRYQDPAQPGGDPLRLAALQLDETTELASYLYDEAGNTTSRTMPDGSTAQQRWDGPSSLRKVTTPAGSETYFYDGASRVAAVHRNPDGSVNRVRRYFGEQEIVYTPGQAPAYRQSIALAGTVIGRVDGDEATGTMEHYTTTSQGHHVLALDATTGTTRRVASYGAYGELLEEKTAEGNRPPAGKYPQEFNGKDFDQLSGLHHYGARAYDPVALQWTSADPLYSAGPDLDPANPTSANLYTFTGNDPINRIDPTGLDDTTNSTCPVGYCDDGEIIVIEGTLPKSPDDGIPSQLGSMPAPPDFGNPATEVSEARANMVMAAGVREHSFLNEPSPYPYPLTGRMEKLPDGSPSTMTHHIISAGAVAAFDAKEYVVGYSHRPGGYRPGGRYGAMSTGKGQGGGKPGWGQVIPLRTSTFTGNRQVMRTDYVKADWSATAYRTGGNTAKATVQAYVNPRTGQIVAAGKLQNMSEAVRAGVESGALTTISVEKHFEVRLNTTYTFKVIPADGMSPVARRELATVENWMNSSEFRSLYE